MRRNGVASAARVIALLAVLGVAVFPVYWMLVTSLTSDADLFGSGLTLLPDLGAFHTYADAFAQGRIQTWLLNSAIIAGGTAFLSISLAIPLGYALSRFSFRGKALVAGLLLLTQMLPEALLVIPLFGIFRDLGLLNSLTGLVFVNASFVLPVVALLVKNAIDGIPRELEEAARVDGCTPISVLTRINVPLIAPTLAAAGVIAFFHGWNEYVFAVTFLFDESKRPASVGLASFIGEQATSIQSVMAVGLVYTLPAVLFYLFAQKYVVSGMTAGGVKG